MCMCLCMGMGMCKGKCMCVLSLLCAASCFLGLVRRRTTTEPFIKDVVIDHERRLGLKTLTVVVLTTNHTD